MRNMPKWELALGTENVISSYFSVLEFRSIHMLDVIGLEIKLYIITSNIVFSIEKYKIYLNAMFIFSYNVFCIRNSLLKSSSLEAKY